MLIVLIGAPGAGKSTLAEELVTLGVVDRDAVASSDAIAVAAFGPDYGPERDPEIFAERDRVIAERLANGLDAIADSTNVIPAARTRLLTLARAAGASAIALRFDVPLATLRERDRSRPHSVADVDGFHAQMEATASAEQLRAEGFDGVFDVGGEPQTAARGVVDFLRAHGASR